MGGGELGHFEVSVLTEYCTESGGQEVITYGNDYVSQFIADEGYEILPENVVVSISNTNLIAGTNFIFADNTLTVPNVVGALSVFAVATQKTVTPTEIAATQQGVQVCAVSAAEGLQLVGLA